MIQVLLQVSEEISFELILQLCEKVSSAVILANFQQITPYFTHIACTTFIEQLMQAARCSIMMTMYCSRFSLFERFARGYARQHSLPARLQSILVFSRSLSSVLFVHQIDFKCFCPPLRLYWDVVSLTSSALIVHRDRSSLHFSWRCLSWRCHLRTNTSLS